MSRDIRMSWLTVPTGRGAPIYNAIFLEGLGAALWELKHATDMRHADFVMWWKAL